MRKRKRQKKKYFVQFLIILIIFISLGFALLRADLKIVGIYKVNQANWDIHFDNLQVTEGSVSLSEGDSAATINPTATTSVNYSITLKKPGQYYEFTVDVVNNSSFDANVETVTSTLNGVEITSENPLPNYLYYSVSYEDGAKIRERQLLAKNTRDTYKVRIEFYEDINQNDLPASLQTLSLSFQVTYVQSDYDIVDKSVPTLLFLGQLSASYFKQPAYKEKIKTINFGKKINIPDDAIESWDIGVNQNGDVMAYITQNEDDNTMYDLYIQGDGCLYANANSEFLFANLKGVDSINNIDILNTSKVIDMNNMFYNTGYNSTIFTLNLGDKFDTSKVTNMNNMFDGTGYSSTVFTLDLGDYFDTSKVSYMNSMFDGTGYNSTNFTLDLDDKFDTSKVKDMSFMFSDTGYSSTNFTLDLGDKFDTSQVTSMFGMFRSTGYSSTNFTLDLGDKFDTSQVTIMADMFRSTGYSSTNFTLDLGDKFDTSQVTNMSSMFISTGYSSTNFTLDLGDKFDTSQVTSMTDMFRSTGYSSTNFTLDLGDKFDTSQVTSMSSMFRSTGYSSTNFTLDFGDKFDTSKVTNMSSLFDGVGFANPNLELDLSTFNFDLVNQYSDMFKTMRTTNKIWVKNASDQTWIINHKGSGELSTSNVLIKGT